MLFNSYLFLLFFLPLCLILYFVLNRKGWHRLALLELLIMSFWFYASNHIQYLLILIISIVFNWICSRFLLGQKGRVKNIILWFGIGLNIGIIFYFKYFNFFVDNINLIFKSSYVVEKILLPLGISFFTFQQISYLIDSGRGETAEYTFLEYAVFVSFFPQLVAGPIVLHDEIIPQFRDPAKKALIYQNIANGLWVLAIGLVKKVIIADTFGNAVAWGYKNFDSVSSLEIFLIMLFYTFQIYFDFSGYSDMAIGIGKMFNIDLPMNFDSPYKSYSITEFWGRWHMTLTRFLRKYIYFPLGGSRKGNVRTFVNVFAVFLISGIWHGANWTFIVWGMVHGVANILNRIFAKTWDKWNEVFRWVGTFIFINFTWLIFRSDSVYQAVIWMKRMLCMDSFSISCELMECFDLTEFSFLNDTIKPIGILAYKINGFYMWVFLAISFFIVLNVENIHKIQFKASLPKAIVTTVFFLWSIVSLAGITTFLYFNF